MVTYGIPTSFGVGIIINKLNFFVFLTKIVKFISHSLYPYNMTHLRKDNQPIDVGPNMNFEEFLPSSKKADLQYILVIGSGGGVYTCRLYLEGFRNVVGVDIDFLSVEYSQRASRFLEDPRIKEQLMEHYPSLPKDLIEYHSEYQQDSPHGLDHLMSNALSLPFSEEHFDYVLIPWLLGTKNGIIHRDEQLRAIEEAIKVTNRFVKITPLPQGINKETELALIQCQGLVGLYEDIINKFGALYHIQKDGLGILINKT